VVVGPVPVLGASLGSTFVLNPATIVLEGIVSTGTVPTTFQLRVPTVIPAAIAVSMPTLGSTFTLRQPNVLAVYGVAGATVPTTFVVRQPSVLAVWDVSLGTCPTTFAQYVPTLVKEINKAHLESTFVLHGPSVSVGAIAISLATVPSGFAPYPVYVIRASDAVDPDRMLGQAVTIRRSVIAPMSLRRSVVARATIHTTIPIGKGER
jgi:hypothetical protein